MINNELISNTCDLSKCSTWNPNNRISNTHLFSIIKIFKVFFLTTFIFICFLFDCLAEMRLSLSSTIFINMFNVKMKITKDKY